MILSSSKILIAIVLMSQIRKTTPSVPFCVTRSSNTDGPSPIIDFDAECFEPGEEASGFDLITDTFSPPYSGLYWLHFSAGLPDTGDLTDVQLALPTRTINIHRSSGGRASLSSRSDIVELTAGVDRLHLTSADTLYSNVADVQVSWSGFHLDSLMTEVVAFSVAMSPGTFTDIDSNIPFDVVFVDTHSDWAYDHYTIPVGGLWLMSLHIGDPPKYEYSEACLYLTPSEYAGFVVATTKTSNYAGAGTVSVTVVVQVNAGVKVTARSFGDDYIYSDSNYPTAMSGFLYSPTTQPAVAWTVAANQPEFGPVDPVPFGDWYVNQGNGFKSNNTFIAPHAGLYYVAMAGTSAEADMKMELLLNGIVVASVYYFEESGGAQTRSRAIIVRLSVGDELRVRVPAGYSLYNFFVDVEFTVFTGFRISP